MRLPGDQGSDLVVGEGRTRLMGVVNVTPDSFSDGGRFLDPQAAVDHGLAMVEAGADLLDVGGESTRPGHERVSAEEQVQRVLPVIVGLRRHTNVPITIDTTDSRVAASSLDAGADWINDTTALRGDPGMAPLAARRGCPVVLMHRFDPPRESSARTTFGSDGHENSREILHQIADSLSESVKSAEDQGVDPARILLDPGLGFGTLYEDNLVIMADVGPLRRLQKPLLFGPSRKSFIGQLTGQPVEDRVFGTAAAVAILAMQGVEILRVHDVAAMVDVVKVSDGLRNSGIEQTRTHG